MLSRAVMGSVSNHLAKHCPCPVLVVKIDHSEIEARKEMNEKKNAKFADVLGMYIFFICAIKQGGIYAKHILQISLLH